MPAAPVPHNEAKRLEALGRMGLIAVREDRFDRLTQLACAVLDVPIAIISLVEKERQWFKSCIGSEDGETPRDAAFCAYTILSDRPLVVSDAKLDPRFADNPLVTGAPHIRFYAGFPLHGPGGYRVGSLCVIDTCPRQISAREMESLKSLGEIAETELNAVTLAEALNRLSEQKRELQEQKELFELFVENNPGIVSIKDEHGRLVMVNKKVEQYFNVTREEVIGKLDADWLTAETVEQSRQHDCEALDSGHAVEKLRTTPATDGSTQQWHVMKFPFQNRAGQRFVGGVSSDITKQMMAEAGLREKEQQYRNLFENSSDLIQSVDADGCVLYVNRAWRESLGYEAAEVESGFSIYRVLHPDHASAYREMLRKIFADEGDQRLDAQFVTKDGRVLEIEGNVGCHRKDGVPFATCGIYRDISSRKQMEAVLHQARHDAEEASMAKSQFLANISHEIRTPLNGIIGMSSMLMGAGLNETQRRYARTIESSGSVLLTLVNQVLDFSKLEASAVHLEQIPFRLPVLIEEVATLMSIRAHEKELTLRWSIAADVPETICGDPVRLRQILSNLLGNAVKFTEAGSVHLQVALEESAIEKEIILRCKVADTGIGLEPGACERIFGAFSQADPSTTRKFGGTGLGLTISRQFVELMGGHIQVESKPGEGSVFSFTAHFTRAESVPETPVHFQPSAVSTRPLRILVAEDNAVNQIVLTEQLSRLGHSCVTVDNGREALNELATASYDALLIDCQMPVLDGYETVEELRRNDPDTWVVAITANAMPGEREKCEAIGMDDFLLKPFLPEELAAMLGRVPLREKPAKLQHSKPHFPLDSARLESLALARTSTGESLLMKMTVVFVASTPAVLDEIGHALSAGDPLGAARAAHKLAGGCGYFGAERLRGLCAEVERLGRDGQLDPLWLLAREIRSEYEIVESALKNLPMDSYSLAQA